MSAINYRVHLDVGLNGSQGIIYARQGDTRTRSIVMMLYNGASPVELSDSMTAILSIKRTDSTFDLTDCTIDGNIITCVVTNYMTACSGNNECQLLVSDPDSEGTLYSPSFDLYIEEAMISPDDIASLPEYSALSTALNAAAAYRTKWSNPTINVENAEAPGGTITFSDDGVLFDIKVQQGRPAEIGDQSGYLVETGEDGVLTVNRRLVIGTEEPEERTDLLPGDIYIKY